MRQRLVLGALGLLWVVAGCSGQSQKEHRAGPVETPIESCQCPLDWQIDNLGVCIGQHTAFTDTLLYSSSLVNGRVVCNAGRSFPQPVPSQPWSAQRMSSPCAGAGSLTLRVRQGKAEDPLAEDCIVAEQHFDFDYDTANQPLALPEVSAWSAQDQACARAYEEEGGYLEFRVDSAEIGCGQDGTTVKYVNQCPLVCDLEPGTPGCEDCGMPTLTNSF